MTRLFMDSSVFFSAAYSVQGHAHDLILLAVREEVNLVISPLVLEETRRNLFESAPEKLPAYERIVANVPFELVQPARRSVLAASKHVAWKDAAIVAAVRKARVDLFVTLDKKHLLGRPELSKYVRAPIVTPREAMAALS